ncbi:glycoside hydrolase family 1 protein [Neobittarella massiliensis]|uniref:Glycoside hydrolase family 1 protein n=1 Tax=Neobittarella massiliensis (ex Bilen et al. 2018) TaxID=2041842 RepID=A0A8J6INN8_9FIRM|nr:glycoside hydrolase family 1 protein [Neobittarella massiliensis]MBC3516192.1 glycoside hydrolase family 1 protein [Neobittarella massiliensis]
MKTLRPFPKDFLWGAATSAYQVEGAAQLEGKKLSQQDVINRRPGVADAEVASDHYHRYKEDVALMKELGLRSYRFSLAWARIFPDGVGDPNPQGVQFYHHLLDELQKAGITPIVTLYHYDMPLALVEKYDGWIDRQSVADFAYYTEFVLREYGSKVKYWLTINEQSIIVQYWTKKNLIPEKYLDDPQVRYQINHHMNLAHATACKLVHQLVPGGMVGAAINTAPIYPLTSTPCDVMAAQNALDVRNLFYLDVYFKGQYNKAAFIYLEEMGVAPKIEPGDLELFREGYSDFLALNYYSSDCAKFPPPDAQRTESGVNYTGKKGEIDSYETMPDFFQIVRNPNCDTTDWDWAIDPTGLECLLRDIYTRYGKPLMITENGLGFFDKLEDDGTVHDDYRIDYLRSHIRAVQRAMHYGVEVLSYNPWSFMDLLSTENGYQKRYGFVYVDRGEEDLRTLDRIKKDSYYWYQQVIASGGQKL